MPLSRPAALRAVALLVVAPIGAAVLIGALMLFGVSPHLVFLPGFVVKSRLEALGVHVPKPLGVLCTLVFWWGIIVAVWLAVRGAVARARLASPPPTRRH